MEQNQKVTVISLYIYPVKSLKGIALQQAQLTPQGLAFDRHWMITDEEGRFVTQRQLPQLTLITTQLTDSHLLLSYPGLADLAIPLNKEFSSAPIEQLKIHADVCSGFDEGQQASDWLTEAMQQHWGKRLFLKRFNVQQQRPVEPEFLAEQADTHFADAYPILVCNQASLDKLNQELQRQGEQTVSMERFRPNIVIEGLPAFAEDKVNELAAEDLSIRIGLRKPCQRCKMTTIDPQTGAINNPKQPLKTLISLNHFEDLKGAYFGQNAIVLQGASKQLNSGSSLLVLQ